MHAKALQNRQRRPLTGDVVTYAVAKDHKGRNQAQSVTFAGEKLVSKAAKTPAHWPSWVVIAFFILLAGACWAGKLHIYLIAGYAGISLITYISYWLDKHKAQKKRWRTPESSLHLLSLLGGWPGALMAQNRLRHKSKKRSFLLVFWCTVPVNIAVLIWLSGQQLTF